MHQEPEVKKMLEDGTYYEEARSWYSSIYLSVISERYFYILLSALAVLTMCFSLAAFFALLPINRSVPILYSAENVLDDLPSIAQIADGGSAQPDNVLRSFFSRNYVQHREQYQAEDIARNAKVVMKNSSRAIYMKYLKEMDASNPRSPIARYEANYKRDVEVTRVVIKPNDLDADALDGQTSLDGVYGADIYYKVHVYGEGRERRSKWRATVRFAYDVLIIKDKRDMTEEELAGENTHSLSQLKVDPMKFQVTEYSVEQME